MKKVVIILEAGLDYLWNMFSVTAVVRNFFSPWKRIVSARRPGLDGLRDWLIDNFISRSVGAMMRTFLLLAAIICLSFYSVLAIMFFVFWLFAPVGLIFSFFWLFRGEAS